MTRARSLVADFAILGNDLQDFPLALAARVLSETYVVCLDLTTKWVSSFDVWTEECVMKDNETRLDPSAPSLRPLLFLYRQASGTTSGAPETGDLFQLIGGSDDEQASKKPEKADKPGKQPDNAEACKMQTG